MKVRGRTRWLGAAGLGVVALLALGCWAFWPGEKRLPEEAAFVDVTPRPLEPIPPGTVIADRAPAGWSHLIIKSHPRVGEETIGRISETTARMAGLLFTAMLADVRPEPGQDGTPRFHLRAVGVGVGTDVDGKEMILSSQTQKQLGAELSLIDRTVLAGGEDQLRQMRLVARTPTMALIDNPTTLLYRKKHRRVVFRYAILVAPQSGRLDTLMWLLLPSDDQGSYKGPIGPLQRFSAEMVEDCVLHVDPDEFLLGIPTPLGFARERIPRGTSEVPFPEGLRPAAARRRFSPESVRTLQKRLAAVLSQARP